jgi:serine phosphatase RsbU (regulator of sigma subunit)
MTNPIYLALRNAMPASLRDFRSKLPLASLLRKDVASSGSAWLPLSLVLGAIAAVAYADHLVVSVSLAYLYILPLSVGAIFLRKWLSYVLIVISIVLHDSFSRRPVHVEMRIFDNLAAMLCFVVVVYFLRRYMEQREALAKTVQQQRDDLVQDLKLAAQVQRLFLPSEKAAIPGLEIAGMMHPAHTLGGDYYDYIPVDAHTTQFVIADVAGKGVPAALLMSATAAAVHFEANHDRNMLQQVERLNTEIRAVSDDERYVTLMIAEIDTRKRTLRYVNCGHNPALLFRAKTGELTLMNSSCPPIGLSPEEICNLDSIDLGPGDVLVFYTDGVTEAENRLGEEFGLQRLSAVVRDGSSLLAKELASAIFDKAADFCSEVGFYDDVTILVVKCLFGSPSTLTP